MQRSRRVVLFALTLVALATSAATAHAAAWLQGPTLSRTLAYFGDVTTDAAGVSTAVWPDDGSGPSHVIAQRIDPVRGSGALLDLGPGETVSVGATAAGGAVVTWARDGAAPGETEVVARSIAADGTLGPVRGVASTTDALGDDLIGSVAPDGAVVAVWTTEDAGEETLSLHARRVAADGALGAQLDLGLTERHGVQAATTADGVTRVLWSREQAGGDGALELRVARIDAAGALGGSPLTVSGDPLIGPAALGSGPGGAVATWFEAADGSPTQALSAVRLRSTGAVTGAQVVVAPSVPANDRTKVAAAVSPGGTATFAWDAGEDAAASIVARQLATDGTLGPVRQITQTPDETRDLYPLLRPLGDGSLLAIWLHDAVDEDARFVSRTLAADGTPTGAELAVPMPASIDPARLRLGIGLNGDGLAAAVLGEGEAFVTARFDAAPPLIDATVPATVVRGADGSFSATAADPSGIASYDWQFGDGSGASGAVVAHAYAGTGTYAVAVRATDNSGNSATVTKTITVVEPAPAPAPAPVPGPGPGPGPVKPGPGPAVPAARRVPARLTLTKASRSGASVTVAGTLDRRASGRVTVTWSQQVGRRAVRRSVRARIVRGRFATTLRLPRALARSQAAGRLTVSYGGDAAVQRASVTRVVKAKQAARRRVR